MTVSDLERDVRVRTRTHPEPETPVSGGSEPPKSARARAIPDDDLVRNGDAPGQEVEIVDHSALISELSGRRLHLAEAGLALGENFLTSTPPTTVGAAWRGIDGDPDEEPRAGLARVALWPVGVLRALALTVLYGAALTVSTRARTAGTLLVVAVLVAVYCTARALLP